MFPVGNQLLMQHVIQQNENQTRGATDQCCPGSVPRLCHGCREPSGGHDPAAWSPASVMLGKAHISVAFTTRSSYSESLSGFLREKEKDVFFFHNLAGIVICFSHSSTINASQWKMVYSCHQKTHIFLVIINNKRFVSIKTIF